MKIRIADIVLALVTFGVATYWLMHPEIRIENPYLLGMIRGIVYTGLGYYVINNLERFNQ